MVKRKGITLAFKCLGCRNEETIQHTFLQPRRLGSTLLRFLGLNFEGTTQTIERSPQVRKLSNIKYGNTYTLSLTGSTFGEEECLAWVPGMQWCMLRNFIPCILETDSTQLLDCIS